MGVIVGLSINLTLIVVHIKAVNRKLLDYFQRKPVYSFAHYSYVAWANQIDTVSWNFEVAKATSIC